MKTQYQISYNGLAGFDLAKVIVDGAALSIMKEMILFWTDGETWLDDENGDILRTWLKMLGRFIMNHRHIPDKNDEGWTPLDGTYGILVEKQDSVFFEMDDIEICSIN